MVSLLVGSACGADIDGQHSAARPTPKPFEQRFDPPYDPRVRTGDLVRIGDAVLDDNRLTLTIRFTGGPAFSPDDPCSTDYKPWVQPDRGMLEAAVARVSHPELATLPPSMGCDAMGRPYTFHLGLAAPFLGTTVRDLHGTTLWVAPPDGLVEPTVLPDGWELRGSFDVPDAQPPLFARVYAADGTDVSGSSGPGMLVVYQAFGEPTRIRRRDRAGRCPHPWREGRASP